MSEATHSEVAMFRAIIALAWADDRLSEEEQERILVYIENNRNLSEAQKKQLRTDIPRPTSMDAVWPEITDVRDRAHVINVADAIFWEDGELCHSEKEVLDRIRSAHIATLDVDAIRDDVVQLRKELLIDRKAFQRELHEMRNPVGRLIHYLETIVDKVA